MKAIHKYLVIGLLLLMCVGTVSAVPAYDANTLFLTHANGTLNSTLFLDEVGHTITSTGYTHINNTANWTKFGTGSAFLGQTGSYISVPYSADFNFAANSFTVDWWLNTTETKAVGVDVEDMYFSQYASTTDFLQLYRTGAPNYVYLTIKTGGTARATYIINPWGGAPPYEKPNHFALVVDRTNTTVTIYVNGTGMAMTPTVALNGNINVNAPIHIGQDPTFTTWQTKGYFDEFRISNNVRWSADFTPQWWEYGTPMPLANSAFTANVTGIAPPPRGVQFNLTYPAYPNIINWSVDGSAYWNNQTAPLTDAMNITYLFTTGGVHTVNLTVRKTTVSGFLFNETSTMYINCNATLNANFNATPLWSKPNRSISFVDMSTGADMYNWTWNFGDQPNLTYPQPVPPPNTSYQRNPTKEGYQLLGNYNVNLTVKGADGQTNTTKNAYIRINMNNTLTVNIRDASTYNLVVAPVIVEVEKSGAAYTNTTTSTGTVTFELPDGSYNLVVPAITGVYYGNIASVVMAGTDTSGIIYLTPVTTTTLQSYVPHQVRFILVDRYANKLPRVTVIVNATGTTLPLGANWFDTMFGVGSGTFPNITSANMTGITGTDGAIVFTMHGSVVYDINMNNATQGIGKVITLTPIQTEYTVWLMTTATAIPPNCGLLINASLFVTEPTTATTYLNLTYADASLSTVNISYFVNYPNYTNLYTKQFIGPSPYNQSFNNVSYPVANTAGEMFVWGFYANTTVCGNVTKVQGITLKGPTGKLVDFDPCGGYVIGWGSAC